MLAWTMVLLLCAKGFGVEVRDFGAQGDGQADDSGALQRAVDSGAHLIHLGAGTYRLTRSVEIDLSRTGPVSMVGDGVATIRMEATGPALRLNGSHGGTADPKSFKPGTMDRERSPMVDGVEIIGAHPEADGVEAVGTMQLVLTRLTVREARHAIRLRVRNRNLLVSDCHLYHNRGVGVFFDAVDLHQANIVGCHISYNAGGGVVMRGGGVRNVQIGTCDLEANMGEGEEPAANVWIDCEGGSTAEVAITGCTLQHHGKAEGSANVVFLGRGSEKGAAFDAEQVRWGHLTIANNILSDTRTNVRLRHARGVTIVGNTFGVGHDFHLLVEDSTNVVVGANSFDRNDRYYYGEAALAKDAIVFRDSKDCTLSGLHVNGVRNGEAGMVFENCEGMHLSNSTVLDCDGAGVLLKNVRESFVTGCVIRERRSGVVPHPSLRVMGGGGNQFGENMLSNGAELDGTRVDRP